MNSSSAEFFERKYRAEEDPWRFRESGYEQARYAATLRALSERRFRRAFEPGCSVGELTRKLAEVCGEVEAWEFSPTAAETARRACAALPGVTVRCEALGSREPDGIFDLIVLSEIGYYFGADELRRCAELLKEHLEAGGWLLAVHWLGHSRDHSLRGDEVHEVLRGVTGWKHLRWEKNGGKEGYRLDLWERER